MKESYFEPKFKLLFENQQAMLEQLAPKSRLEELEDEVAVLRAAVRQHSTEIAKLKQHESTARQVFPAGLRYLNYFVLWTALFWVIWFSIAPAFLCFFDYSITTSGLIRSFGLSFISISAGSTLSRPVNLCVISFSG